MPAMRRRLQLCEGPFIVLQRCIFRTRAGKQKDRNSISFSCLLSYLSGLQKISHHLLTFAISVSLILLSLSCRFISVSNDFILSKQSQAKCELDSGTEIWGISRLMSLNDCYLGTTLSAIVFHSCKRTHDFSSQSLTLLAFLCFWSYSGRSKIISKVQIQSNNRGNLNQCQ